MALNVLEHGTGALNIDGTRISTEDNLNGGTYSPGGNKNPLPGDTRIGASAGMFVEGGGRLPGEFKQPEGRWPANLILQHLPDCEIVGSRKVKTNTPSQKLTCGGATGICYGDYKGERSTVGHADETGKETIPAWECEPGCPVAALDEQSGDRPSTWTNTEKRQHSNAQPLSKFRPDQGTYMPQGPLYADKGGASRFFKQVQVSGEIPGDE